MSCAKHNGSGGALSDTKTMIAMPAKAIQTRHHTSGIQAS
jgi:hypothetical protein